MKKLIVLIFVVAVAALSFAPAHAAVVYKLWLCDALQGNTSVSMDGIHSGNSDLPDGAFAIVIPDVSGVSYVQFFRYDSGTTKDDNVTTHPYQVAPADDPANGVWEEVSGISTWHSP